MRTIWEQRLEARFLFTNKTDYQRFRTHLEEVIKRYPKKKLRMPTLALGGSSTRGVPRLPDYQGPGRPSWMLESLEAEPDVLKYLCAFNQVHQVALLHETPNMNLRGELNRLQVKKAYTKDTCTTWQTSRFTNESVTSSHALGNARWLKRSTEQDAALLRVTREYTEAAEVMTSANNAFSKLRGDMAALKAKISALKEDKRNAQRKIVAKKDGAKAVEKKEAALEKAQTAYEKAKEEARAEKATVAGRVSDIMKDTLAGLTDVSLFERLTESWLGATMADVQAESMSSLHEEAKDHGREPEL